MLDFLRNACNYFGIYIRRILERQWQNYIHEQCNDLMIVLNNLEHNLSKSLKIGLYKN
jgi:hypothetical protein